MKRILLYTFLMAFAIVISNQASGQKDDFTGTWKLDMTKSTLPEYTPILVRINVKISGDTLLTERYYDTGDGQEYPFTENLTLDGKEYNITIYDMPRKSKASWSDQDKSLLVESTTTFYGDSGAEDFISAETWKADNANKTLAINFKNKAMGGEAEGVFFFNKAE